MDTNPNVNIKTTVTNKKLHLTIGEGKVTTNKIADDAITSDKITDGAVINAKLADNAVTTEKIEDDSISSDKIQNSAIVLGKIAENAIEDWNITDNAITTDKLATSAVTNAKLADNAVSTECIEDSSITTDKIVDGAVTDAKLSQTLQDTIDDKVDSSDFNTAIGNLRNAIEALSGFAMVAVDTLPTASADVMNTIYLVPTAGSVENAKDMYICISDGLGGYQWEYIGTTGAVDLSGYLQDINNSVKTNNIQDSAITSAKLASNAVTTAKINSNAISSVKIANGAVTSEKIASYAITSNKIDNRLLYSTLPCIRKFKYLSNYSSSTFNVTVAYDNMIPDYGYVRLNDNLLYQWEPDNDRVRLVKSDSLYQGIVYQDRDTKLFYHLGSQGALNLVVPPDNSVTNSTIVDGAITSSKLDNQSITSGKLELFSRNESTTAIYKSAITTTDIAVVSGGNASWNTYPVYGLSVKFAFASGSQALKGRIYLYHVKDKTPIGYLPITSTNNVIVNDTFVVTTQGYNNPTVSYNSSSTNIQIQYQSLNDYDVNDIIFGFAYDSTTPIDDTQYGYRYIYVRNIDDSVAYGNNLMLYTFVSYSIPEAINTLACTKADKKDIPINASAVGAIADEDGAVLAKHIDDDAVTTIKIQDEAVTTDKIADQAVDGDKIADQAVDSQHIVGGAVTESKIDNGAVTYDKLSQTVKDYIDTQADWNQSNSSARDYIKNKPIVPPNIKHIIRIEGYAYDEEDMLNSAGDGEYWIDIDEEFGENLFLVTDNASGNYRTLVPYSDDTLYIDSEKIWIYNAINDSVENILIRTALGDSPIYYGTCFSSGSSSALDVNCSNFKLKTGAVINVKFSNDRTVSGTCTMNVGNTTAKDVKFGHSTTVPDKAWKANQVIKFVYDGTYFVTETAKATTTTLGLTTLTDSVSSTNTNSAATPNSVKRAYDLAASKTDKMELVPISSVPVAAVNLAIGQYYRFDINLTSFTGLLPTVTADDNLKSICLCFTTGDNPSITFVSSDNPLLYYDGYSIEANTTYVINITNLGTKWVVAYSIVDVPQNVGGGSN